MLNFLLKVLTLSAIAPSRTPHHAEPNGDAATLPFPSRPLGKRFSIMRKAWLGLRRLFPRFTNGKMGLGIKIAIDYITTDEVNADYAEQLARQEGVDLQTLHPTQTPRSGAAMVVDWDCLSAQQRQQVYEAAEVRSVPMAVHSYSVEYDPDHPELRHLQSLGFVLRPRLEASLFSILAVRKAA